MTVKHEIESYRGRLPNHDAALRYAARFDRGARRRTHQSELTAVAGILGRLCACRRLLDTPCGAGRFLSIMASHVPDLTLMDTSPAVLQLARERAGQLGVKARFIVGDASRTGLRDGCVDIVFCNRLLHHIHQATERAVFLREFHRVTSSYLVVSFFDYLKFGPVRAWLKLLKGRRVNYAGQPTQAQFEAELTECGFRLLSIRLLGPPWVAQKYLVLEKESAEPR